MVIGRLITVEPREGEMYYIRLLLTHVQEPTSFDDLLKVRGHKTDSLREACLLLGLLESDSYIEEALQEAAHFQMPYLLRMKACILFDSGFNIQLKRSSFFIDSPGGTGKTFLCRVLLPFLRSQGYVAIAVATSGVATPIIPGGRTDEASMAKTETIEAVHCLLTDIVESDVPFGGKTIIFGGDFRQTLPVIEQLGEVGEDVEPVDEHGQMSLPPHMVISYHNKEESLDRLFGIVFPDLNLYSCNPYRIINRCVLCPKNSSVDEINRMMIAKFPENLHRYRSCDRTVDKRNLTDYEDFLNSFNPKEWYMLFQLETSYQALKAEPAKSPFKKNNR
ncbi:uncharacterized protein [Coffea arabica]|uniref:ATP-dependent DNA helicase n=1 Tax=Coffea arabica TaxID=13443 RepID=A0ABM4V386_COFAR